MLKDGQILSREKVDTEKLAPGSPTFLDRVFSLFALHIEDCDTKIGVSWNAPVFRSKLTQSSLLGGRIDVDLGDMLTRRFDRDVQVESDVHAMAIGEHRFGAVQSSEPFILLNLGSGAGLAYHEGTLMRGYRGGAGLVSRETRYVGEIGENVNIDNLLSGRGVSFLYNRLTGESISSALVAERLGNDPKADLCFHILGTHLGAYMISLSRLFNPRTFVLAGSVTAAAPNFLDNAKEILFGTIEPACRPDAVVVSQVEAVACRGLV
jgi:predicted NBD/HSP70 family sugar kinase